MRKELRNANLSSSQTDALNRRIRMKVVPFVTSRPKAGRRGSPAIPSNTKLYAIAYHHPKGGFYTYSYFSPERANQAIEMMKLQQTDNDFYYPWNVVYDVNDTMHVGTA